MSISFAVNAEVILGTWVDLTMPNKEHSALFPFYYNIFKLYFPRLNIYEVIIQKQVHIDGDKYSPSVFYEYDYSYNC